MGEQISVTITRQDKYKFVVDFGPVIAKTVADEPAPLGDGAGPSPTQLLGCGRELSLLKPSLRPRQIQGGSRSVDDYGDLRGRPQRQKQAKGHRDECHYHSRGHSGIAQASRPRFVAIRRLLHRVAERADGDTLYSDREELRRTYAQIEGSRRAMIGLAKEEAFLSGGSRETTRPSLIAITSPSSRERQCSLLSGTLASNTIF